MQKSSGKYISDAAFVLSTAGLGIYLCRNGLIGPVDLNFATIAGAVVGGWIGWMAASIVEG